MGKIKWIIQWGNFSKQSQDHINFTEDRAVLHTCLRAPLNSTIHPQNDENMKNILTDVHEVLGRI